MIGELTNETIVLIAFSVVVVGVVFGLVAANIRNKGLKQSGVDASQERMQDRLERINETLVLENKAKGERVALLEGVLGEYQRANVELQLALVRAQRMTHEGTGIPKALPIVDNDAIARQQRLPFGVEE